MFVGCLIGESCCLVCVWVSSVRKEGKDERKQQIAFVQVPCCSLRSVGIAVAGGHGFALWPLDFATVDAP